MSTNALTLDEAVRMIRAELRANPRRLRILVAEMCRDQVPPRWMYAIQADGCRGDIKLGISRNPIVRLKTLQVGTSQELRGIAAWPALGWMEEEIHRQFANSWIRGEWFMYSLQLQRLVRDLGGDFKWERK